MSKKIALTLGNPNGIGPEICFKALKKFPGKILRNILIIGNETVFSYYSREFDDYRLNRILINDKISASFNVNPGEKSLESGLLSYLYLKKAVELAKEGKVSAIVTAPISKELIVNSGIKDFIDHTTYLAGQFNVKDYNMMFHSDDLKVVLTTIHIPISEVSRSITRDKVDSTINNSVLYCRSFKKRSFRIAVCGLNPHAGENGIIGTEEIQIIKPVVEEYKKNGIDIEGPLPADSVFYKAYSGYYDLVVAMYHDQALAPFKLLHFMDGVNMTLGLPVIRTSPDHGTAFDIAGKDIADGTSMFKALELAVHMMK